MKRKKSDCSPNPNKKAKTEIQSQENVHAMQNLNGTGWTLAVRPLQKDDIAKVEDIFATIRDWEDYIYWEEKPQIVALFDQTGIWRSSAVFYGKDDTAKISLLATSVSYRRQGLGRVVVHFMIDHLKTRFEHVIAAVMDEKKATGFWTSLGFGQTDDEEFKKKLHKNETTLPVYKLEKAFAPFSECQFQPAKRKLNLERFVETEEELVALKAKLDEMDNGALIETDSDDSDFEP